MGRRIVRVLVLSTVITALVALQGVPLASGEEDEHPVGYSVGFEGKGGRAACNFYRIDLTTGDATRVNPVGVGVECADGLTFDDDGELYAYRNGPAVGAPSAELITIDLKTGVQHVVGALPRVLVGGGGMTFDADGDLWLYAITSVVGSGCASGRYCLWEVDPDTAASTFRGQLSQVGLGVFGLTADCEDVIAITSDFGDGFAGPNAALAEVHTSNGALTSIVSLPGIEFPTGLDFEDDGDLWALATSGVGGAGIGATLFRIDPSDGTSQAKDITVGGASFAGIMNGLAVDPISCEDPDPEPTPTPTPPAVVVAPTFTG